MMTIKGFFPAVVLLLALTISGCASNESSVYQQLGGQQKVAEMVDNFIGEIEFDPIMFAYFKDSNIERFREKLIEHLCFLTGGGCRYTGDTMRQVHTGMNIPESDFNHGVDLFIKAMDKANIPHRIQNKILATIVPSRKEIIYL
ncbi:MAG: hemoglobin [Paraglaciecola sp.]|jgi:hemoglobin